MNYKEISRITKELERKETYLEKQKTKHKEKEELIEMEIHELQDNLQSAIHGDTSYLEEKEIIE